MKINRRGFLQLSLASTLVSALADNAEANGRSEGHADIDADYEAKLVEGKLNVQLFLTNRDTKPVDVLVMGGFSPSVELTATPAQGGEPVELFKIPESKREQMELYSRMGPRPSWSTLQPNESRRVGQFQSAKPNAPALRRVKLSLKLTVRQGVLELPETMASVQEE